MMRDLHEMPWVGFDELLDLSNTIALGSGASDVDGPDGPNGTDGPDDVDFFADPDLTRTWRDRASATDLATLPLDELRELRRLILVALDAADRSVTLPAVDRISLNDLSLRAPITFALDEQDRIVSSEVGGDARGRIARKALEVLARSRTEPAVRRCRAPGCGMFFRPGRADQTWCTTRCGTRARAARYRELRVAR